MNKKTSKAPKDVQAVNFPTLGDDFYEAESIRQKRVRKVCFTFSSFFILGFLFFISHMS
jgi:hypothetical protein